MDHQSKALESGMAFSVLVPESTQSPIEVFYPGYGLSMAIVERANIRALGQIWNSSGVYILVGEVDESGGWYAYTGKAPAGLRSRVMGHARDDKKPLWTRALLIRRDTTYGFSSTEVGWLEGSLYDLLQAADRARVDNGNPPGDRTIPPHEVSALELVLEPVAAIMRLIGRDLATADDSCPPSKYSGKPRAYHSTSLSDLHAAGLILSGQRLVSTRASWPAEAKVGGNGDIEWGGNVFTSPSRAAVAAMESQGGPSAVNGWDYWALDEPDGRVPLSVVRSHYQNSQLKDQPTD